MSIARDVLDRETERLERQINDIQSSVDSWRRQIALGESQLEMFRRRLDDIRAGIEKLS